jgi:hypothetical protein
MAGTRKTEHRLVSKPAGLCCGRSGQTMPAVRQAHADGQGRATATDYRQADSNHRIKKKVNNKQNILENNVKNKL